MKIILIISLVLLECILLIFCRKKEVNKYIENKNESFEKEDIIIIYKINEITFYYSKNYNILLIKDGKTPTEEEFIEFKKYAYNTYNIEI